MLGPADTDTDTDTDTETDTDTDTRIPYIGVGANARQHLKIHLRGRYAQRDQQLQGKKIQFCVIFCFVIEKKIKKIRHLKIHLRGRYAQRNQQLTERMQKKLILKKNI